ncbi:pisatin demethylase [Lentithecium fluviatile CBS 122367]|uniref:Pisatin demethylase n=1 Tax=Lentithecium fluviatile CBS 122367 TaxID=1168545 RepID=A0A6G1JFM7_9PLEO|nr:pisatin demethylase [Lentithecium fluviatile CBS 122367]
MAFSIHILPSSDAIAALVLLGLGSFTKGLLSPLRTVPGPFLARFTRLWEIHAVRSRDFATYNIALHKKYGSIVRLAPNRYSLNDADAGKWILGHKTGLDKSNFYYPFGFVDTPNLFSETSNATHAKLRRPIAQVYSTTNLLHYEPFVDTCTAILIKRLDEYAREGKQLPVRELMQYYAFDVIGAITTGSRFGLLEENGDKSGIIEALDEGLDYSAIVGLIPVVHWWISKVVDLLGIKLSFIRMIDFINLHLNNRVSGRSKSPLGCQDFVDKMLQSEQDGKATRTHTFIACAQNIAAGSDTTAISLSSVIAHLCIYPEAMTKLRQELDEARKDGRLSDPATFQEAQKLPYLQAVIYEALRVHPAVGVPLTRVVGKAGAHLAGQYFPPGTEVGVNAWVIHNNEHIFGPDASQFRPERWLSEDSAERAALERNFLSFGIGPRTCIGKNISLLEMLKVIPQIVMGFDFELQRDERSGERYTWRTSFFTKQSFCCLVRKRSR